MDSSGPPTLHDLERFRKGQGRDSPNPSRFLQKDKDGAPPNPFRFAVASQKDKDSHDLERFSEKTKTGRPNPSRLGGCSLPGGWQLIFCCQIPLIKCAIYIGPSADLEVISSRRLPLTQPHRRLHPERDRLTENPHALLLCYHNSRLHSFTRSALFLPAPTRTAL